jgi:hypothetical protein
MSTIKDGIDNGTLMPCSKEVAEIYHSIVARMNQKNPATFITKDGVSDADLIRAARDMYEALMFAEFALEHPGTVAQAALLREIGKTLAKARGES